MPIALLKQISQVTPNHTDISFTQPIRRWLLNFPTAKLVCINMTYLDLMPSALLQWTFPPERKIKDVYVHHARSAPNLRTTNSLLLRIFYLRSLHCILIPCNNKWLELKNLLFFSYFFHCSGLAFQVDCFCSRVVILSQNYGDERDKRTILRKKEKVLNQCPSERSVGVRKIFCKTYAVLWLIDNGLEIN